MSAPDEVRAPSDGVLAGARIGGRVVEVGSDAISLADAFAVVRLARACADEVAVGELVVATLDERCAARGLEVVGDGDGRENPDGLGAIEDGADAVGVARATGVEMGVGVDQG